MNYNETRNYIERHLVKLGWQVRLDKAGYKKIYQYTAGQEDRLGQLYYKLVSVGSMQPKREITDATVKAAIDDLKRMDDIVDKAKVTGTTVPQTRSELDRFSIDQLAKTLETEVALEEKQARIEEEKFPRVEAIKSAAPTTGSLPRILVVDDSPTIRAAVTKALSNDFSFVQAPDGEQAWKMLKDDPSIQLVITDLMMPKLDGYELIKRIRTDRASARISQIPIIVVTTLEDTNAKLRALVAGANDFVTKSTDAAELKMRVMARYKVAQSAKALEHASQSASPSTAGRSSQGATASSAAESRSAAATHMSAGAAATSAAKQQPAPAARSAQGAANSSARPAAGPSGSARPAAAAASRSGAETVAPQARGGVASGGQAQASQTMRLGIRNPINPASVITPTRSSLGQFSGIINRIREWYATVNPLTATTVGGTALVILAIVVIVLINRPSQTVVQTAAIEPDAETVADSSVADSINSTATNSTRQSEPARGTASRSSRTADATKPASTGKIQERATVPATEKESTEVVETSTAYEPKKPETAAKAKPADPSPAVVAGRKSDTTVQTDAPSAAQPASDGGKVAAVAQTASTAAVAAPAAAPAPSVVSNVISQPELTTLIKRFEFVYEAGDIEQFLRLFDEDVRTNERFSKAGLREDYEELFKTTEMRVMSLKNVTWELHGTKADGWGNFEVKVRRAGDPDVREYKGSLTFNVEKIDGRIRIKRLYHGQWRAS